MFQNVWRTDPGPWQSVPFFAFRSDLYTAAICERIFNYTGGAHLIITTKKNNKIYTQHLLLGVQHKTHLVLKETYGPVGIIPVSHSRSPAFNSWLGGPASEIKYYSVFFRPYWSRRRRDCFTKGNPSFPTRGVGEFAYELTLRIILGQFF
jgi:hypothetical protein